eukprot:TRINITY_DN90833_c0_g1_i1.p1 TRINITY_DN90833_c0_g1~~TRINITY_DN90833_c0_g1_i1.p1  ORF type:complete len:892 (-),score=168.62 TRINITY_DN90833_c0_g1_i1:111-2699(-)
MSSPSISSLPGLPPTSGASLARSSFGAAPNPYEMMAEARMAEAQGFPAVMGGGSQGVTPPAPMSPRSQAFPTMQLDSRSHASGAGPANPFGTMNQQQGGPPSVGPVNPFRTSAQYFSARGLESPKFAGGSETSLHAGPMPLGSPARDSLHSLGPHGINSLASTPHPSPRLKEVHQVVTVHVSRLLDVPIEKGMFGGTREYRIRIFEKDGEELERSERIPGRPVDPRHAGHHAAAEIVDVPLGLGVFEVWTTAQLLYIVVEHATLLGSTEIGHCQIHRHDERSSQLWPYVLSKKHRPLDCGIEARIFEGPASMMPPEKPRDLSAMMAPPGSLPPSGLPPPLAHMDTHMMQFQTSARGLPPTGPMGPPQTLPPTAGMPFSPTAPPTNPYAALMPKMDLPPGAQFGPPIGSTIIDPGMRDPMLNPSMMIALQQKLHSIVAVLQIVRVHDLPFPKDPMMNQLDVCVVMTTHGDEKELKRLGPFPTEQQGSHQENSGHVHATKNLARLLECQCVKFDGSQVIVKAPVHFGGAAREGAIFLKLVVAFVGQGSDKARDGEIIGESAPFAVTFDRVHKKYHELRRKRTESSPEVSVGGLEVSHMLVPEVDLEHIEMDGHQPLVFAPRADVEMKTDMPVRISGRPGAFPPMSEEEVFAQASLNAEAINRANLQRCRLADPHSEDQSGLEKHVGHYREWANLDGLFSTMGPNPVAQSAELGADITRVCVDHTSVAEELQCIPGLGPDSPQEMQLKLDMLHQYSKGNPFKVQTKVRPVVCKNPDMIAAMRDLSWLPDPPVYDLVDKLQPDDQETLRLANYGPTANASLGFHDINPNYDLELDIWAAHKDSKSHDTDFHEAIPASRVKDECLLA